MSKPKILAFVLCGPERGQWPAPGLLLRLFEAARLKDVDVELRLVFGIYGYAEARNYAAEEFLNSDADFALMLDNDTEPPADFITRFLDFTRTRPDVDVVALPCYCRPPVYAVAAGLLLCTGTRQSEGAYKRDTQLPSGWLERDVAGAACMFIRRAVLSKTERPWFRIPEHARQNYLFSGAGEDYAFCDAARAAGFHIWTNGDLLCGHLHTVDLSSVAETVAIHQQDNMRILRSLGLPARLVGKEVDV